MYNLGDIIIYKNIKGIVIDKENQIIFDDDNKYKVDFQNSSFEDSFFDEDEDENEDDLTMYIDFVNEIEGEIIDARKRTKND